VWQQLGLDQGGMTGPENKWLLNQALRLDDAVATLLYSPHHLVPTYTKSQITSLKNNYNGATPDPGYIRGWRLTLEGLSSGLTVSLDIETLLARHQIHDQITRLVCVEGWSAIAWWSGLRFDDLLHAYPPVSQAKWALLESSVNLDANGNPDPYFVSLDLLTAQHPQTLLATHLNGKPLPVEHGAPLRLLVPVKLGLKNIKAITRITYTEDEPPFSPRQRRGADHQGHAIRTIGQSEGIRVMTEFEFACRNEVLLSQDHHPEPAIPDPILETWQKIVNLMAEMLDVPAGLIMRIVGEEIHVFVSSSTEGNPYHRGDSEHFWGSGLYCETVVTKNHELLVPNALFDEVWRNNPDVKLKMISYLGYPIRWPNGNPFGTICVLDCKTNSYSEKYKRLVTQFRDIVEIHLEIIYTEAKRRRALERLVDERTASLQVAVAQQIEANNRVLSEMSQRKKTEESLRKAQDDLARISRITTMGALAATIAHEVNQPLCGVLTNGNACLRWLAGGESSSPNLEEVRQAVERMIRDIWPIIPPSVRAAFSGRADENNLISARVLDKQHRRMERDAAYENRLFETALVIRERMEVELGWGEWPEDPHECLAIGVILGLWFERDISQIILEVMEELEDECRERCVSLEFLIVDRMNTFPGRRH
jgi:DMSO/TMAO reductase YedYZ molybdopterin-dependent catalytic subunit